MGDGGKSNTVRGSLGGGHDGETTLMCLGETGSVSPTLPLRMPHEESISAASLPPSPHAAWDGGREIVVDGKHVKNIASCPVI